MKTTFKPKCLRWARERAGFSISELAEKLGKAPSAVAEWEDNGTITLALAERLSQVTYTPLGYLFLSEPPVERLPVSDFRTVGTRSISSPSPNLLDVINDALRRQDWYRDYVIRTGGQRVAFVASIDASHDAVTAAGRIREVISWQVSARAQWGTWEEALAKQIELVEQAGILVMRSGVVGNNTHRPLDVHEFRGFALSDAYAPLIFINGKDTKAAQMFTLAHELVHIWVGASGVTNLEQTYPSSSQNEVFSNAVAAELLVPLDELKAQYDLTQGYANHIERLVRYFKVSSLVILRRLYDAKILDADDFKRRYNDASVQFAGAGRGGGGGNFYTTLRVRLGRRFTSALVENTLEGGTLFRDAYNLLGVASSDALQKLAAEVGVGAG